MKHLLAGAAVALALPLCAPAPDPSQQGTTYYVSPSGDNSDGLSEATAFRTPQQAADLVEPGDTVLLMNGTYVSGPDSLGLKIDRSGTADNWITFRAYPGATPIIKAQAWLGVGIEGAQYITVDGITVEGIADEIDEAEALSLQDSNSGRATNNCIGITANGADDLSHHVVIRNSEARNCAGGGIYSIAADYVTIENNRVRDNAKWSSYANSGISLYQSRDVDASTDVKMIIRNNVVYSNENRIPFRFSADNPADRVISDGNGIIIDDGRNTQAFVGPSGVPYRGRTLIENNIVSGNGGRGIHVYLSDHVDIVNNTTVGNSWSPSIREGEITSIDSGDVFVGNNVVVADYGRPAFTVFPSASDTRFGINLSDGDPLFVDRSIGDFRLTEGSPAIDAGDPAIAPAVDYDGMPRPQGGGVDLGAYER
jgi:parallel beta-helix repeat protein